MWPNFLSSMTLINKISLLIVLFSSNAYSITTPKDFEFKCVNNLTTSGYYSDGYCFTREGPFNIKDTIKNNVCKLLSNGRLMSEHSQEVFSNVSNELVKKSSKEVKFYLENPISIGSTVTIEGQVFNASYVNSITYAYIPIWLKSYNDKQEFVSSPLYLLIYIKSPQNPGGYVSYNSWYDGTWKGPMNAKKTKPASVNRGLNFTAHIKFSGHSKFKVILNEMEYPDHPMPDHSKYPTNYISVGGVASVFSVSINGKKVWPLVTENCPVIGLTASEERNSTDGWYWRSGFEQNWPASPSRTPWDTDNGEPDNKDREESHACIYWETMKLRDYPNYLRRYVICEYARPAFSGQYTIVSEGKKGPAGSVMRSEKGKYHRIQCCVLCNEIPVCKSVSFNKATGECHLQYARSDDPLFPPEAAAGFQFWDRDI